ncbi:unnamed protein product [Didymodactylos carnosus]|uniref:EGF-like domain-containing protein n=1 Tax=Didymodactylos carnosus TaxID=1234261 RepID=A0A813NJ64_9BILA|nr:unnamed protein product [Didymodactylos carnosus]CAF3515266.1 unnamed protein product [Didymodactylos carnosus]
MANGEGSGKNGIQCLEDEFRCDNILCLPLAFVCNGEFNCRDKSDELNCTTAIINNGLCNLNVSINCEQEISHSIRLIEHDFDLEKFLVGKPIQICILRSSVCDGVVDCKNAIDEQCTNIFDTLLGNPMIQCSKEDEYHCTTTNRCIPKAWLCNGINDCKDQYASDESNCEMNEKNQCLSNENKCINNSQCVQKIFECDGLKDCVDGSDERPSLCNRPRFCTPDQFLCKSSQLCVPKSLLCDTVTQCHDNSDELSCTCPSDDYVTTKLFYRCDINTCIEKTLKCDGTNEDCILGNDERDCPTYTSKMCVNNTCSAPNQNCKGYFYRKRCVCEGGYRLNYTTGLCEDVNECSEKTICDHYCINLKGSYRCGCAENYQLNIDKHTCSLRKTSDTIESYMISLGENGLYKAKMINTEFELHSLNNEFDKQFFMDTSSILVKLANASNPYLIDYDWSTQTFYYAECTTLIRQTIMSCAKTLNIYSIKLNERIQEKKLIVNGRDYTSVQSMAVDWLGKNLYFVNTRLQTIDVCKLNGNYCRILLHQIYSDYIPQKILLYPEKGLLFYTAIVKGKSQHIVRMSMDGKNLKLFFTTKTKSDTMNADYLRPLLTIDRKSAYLFYFNGHDQIYTIDMNGHVLSQHYTFNEMITIKPFHAFQIFADKMYQSYYDVKTKRREFRISLKYALATMLSVNNSKTSELSRMLQRFYQFQLSTFLKPRSYLYKLYVRHYPLYMIDFIIVHSSQQALIQNNSCSINNGNCEQLCLLNAMDQTKVTCACAQYYDLAQDGKSCIPNCPVHFFNCPLSKKCIPFYQQCDGINDCFLGEDETNKNCQEKLCNTQNGTTISCLNSSKCISYTDLCNNVTSCPSGEDENELICGHYCEWPSLTTCNKKYGSVCSTEEFLCDGKCVDISHRCDETPYCYDSSDEPFDCKNVTCPSHYFKCPSGKCISLTKVCDNFNDCDGSSQNEDINKIGADETKEACDSLLNTSSIFVCYDNQTRIPLHELCNGRPDCPDSSDEDHCAVQTVCAVNEYKCDERCYPHTIICNGFIDCFDGSDEQNCSQMAINSSAIGCNRPNMFKCKASAYCINETYVCDGDLDCGDSSDEENCGEKKSVLKDETCLSGYRCLQQQQIGDSTKCIPLTELCDGHAQCPFADDEHKSACRKYKQFSLDIIYRIDWIHRIIYAYYNDPSSLESGIEILYSNENYTNLTYIQRLTFSNTKTISAMKVNPFQGYLYISSYFDSQHSLIYRSWLDGSKLEVFIQHVSSPILSMAIDYRHAQLYVLLSNGLDHSEIVSYSLNNKQSWKKTIYAFKDVKSYGLDMHDDTLIIMKQESQDDYHEVWLDKFNRSNIEKYHQYRFPYRIEYIHEYKYPTIGNSNMIKEVCTNDMCKSNGTICITSPEQKPMCVNPTEISVCGYPCHSRGICSNDQCICSNLTYTGDDCKMCRIGNEVIGCVDATLPCVCYLTKSLKYHTPYSCMSLIKREEVEVPCRRVIQISDRKQCTKSLFNPPCVEENTISYETNRNRCSCIEQLFNTSYCNNNGAYSLEDDKPICTCTLPVTGDRCQYNTCKNKCFNNGTCTTNTTHVICLCHVNYSGEQCQTCDLKCKNKSECVLNEKNITVCRCSPKFSGDRCELTVSSQRHFPFIILFLITFILVSIYSLVHFGSRYLKRKILYSHRRLNEQLGLEINNPSYTTVPTTDNTNRDELIFDDLLTNEDVNPVENDSKPFKLVKRDTIMNTDDIDDPFYVDEKQPIFNGRTIMPLKTSNQSLNRNSSNDML